MNIDSRYRRYRWIPSSLTFLVVVASGSFVAAAEQLHVAQSTVSMRIQRLEQALGAELFVRNNADDHHPAGRQFQPQRLLPGALKSSRSLWT